MNMDEALAQNEHSRYGGGSILGREGLHQQAGSVQGAKSVSSSSILDNINARLVGCNQQLYNHADQLGEAFERAGVPHIPTNPSTQPPSAPPAQDSALARIESQLDEMRSNLSRLAYQVERATQL